MKSIDLAGAWRLHRISTKESFPATVPGDTHSALLAAGRIPDPYWGTNELEVQWVGREDWAYERSFDVDAATLEEARIHLTFECLDTLADIYLNGKKVGSADNMFVRWRFDSKRYLRPGKNSLRIVFSSAENAAIAEAKKLPYPVPHVKNPVQSPPSQLDPQGPMPRRLGLGSLSHGVGNTRQRLPRCLVGRPHRLRLHRTEALEREMRRARLR
ncbi:MAG: sugar-binding domain-containing protein [Spirochaetia bacterium]